MGADGTAYVVVAAAFQRKHFALHGRELVCDWPEWEDHVYHWRTEDVFALYEDTNDHYLPWDGPYQDTLGANACDQTLRALAGSEDCLTFTCWT